MQNREKIINRDKIYILKVDKKFVVHYCDCNGNVLYCSHDYSALREAKEGITNIFAMVDFPFEWTQEADNPKNLIKESNGKFYVVPYGETGRAFGVSRVFNTKVSCYDLIEHMWEAVNDAEVVILTKDEGDTNNE